MIKPGIYTDVAGIALMAVMLAGQLIDRRRLQAAT